MESLKKHGLLSLIVSSLIVSIGTWIMSGSLQAWLSERLGSASKCATGALDTKITEEFNYVCDVKAGAQISEAVLIVFFISLFIAVSGVAILLANTINKRCRS